MWDLNEILLSQRQFPLRHSSFGSGLPHPNISISAAKGQTELQKILKRTTAATELAL